MSRIWGGSLKLRKDECIALITSGLEDPEKVQMAVSRLEPWERNALAIVKSAGGKIPYQTLKVSILASGMHPVRIHGYRDNLIDPLFRRGVILARNSYSPEYFTDSFGGSSFVYSDERLLAHVGQPECLALDIQPSEIEGEPLFRRTSAVALDVLGMLQAFQNMGTLKLTQKGTVRVSDETKLRKAMHWSDKGIDVDGFLFPNPVQAWLSAFSSSDLIQRTSDDQLILKESPDQFANRPFGEQIRLLLDGFLRTRTWWEVPSTHTYFDNDGKGRSQGRMALTMALTALPLDPEAVYSFLDFENALYNRIGEDFALDYPPRLPFLFRRDDAEKHEQELLRWQEKTRAAWLAQEYPWLLGAFTTCLISSPTWTGSAHHNWHSSSVPLSGQNLTNIQLTIVSPVTLSIAAWKAAPTLTKSPLPCKAALKQNSPKIFLLNYRSGHRFESASPCDTALTWWNLAVLRRSTPPFHKAWWGPSLPSVSSCLVQIHTHQTGKSLIMPTHSPTT